MSHSTTYSLAGSATTPSDAEREKAAHYIKFLLFNSVLTSTFGIDAAVDRAVRVSEHAWNSLPHDGRPPFDVFTTAYFPDQTSLQDYRRFIAPAGAIPLFLPPRTFDAPVYDPLGHSIVDVIAYDSARIIPSTLFIPYKTRSSRRCQQVLNRINPIPLWFFGEDGVLGVPIQGADKVQLLHGQEIFNLNSQVKPITTLKIKFAWPYYEPTEKQIRASANAPLNNLNRLASLTAGAVRNFMSTHEEKKRVDTCSPPHAWQIGTQPGEISIASVLLLGVIFVSDGAAMPLLAVY